MNFKILIIGEICQDVFIYGDVNRISPEAPIPILEPRFSNTTDGMAGNVQNNLIKLGVDTKLITNDEIIKKIRYVDESYNYILLRVDEQVEIKKINLENLLNENFDGIVISDYNKGFLTEEDIQFISKKYEIPVFLDTKKKLGDWARGVTFLKINHQEYLNNQQFFKNNPDVLNKTIITRGKYGCEFQGNVYPTKEVEVKDVVGAGDTFLAGLVFKYIQTKNIETSILFANKCSTNVVQKRGVAVVNLSEIKDD
jgi:bifunctional ADP-heptose synthase (sugar kinase/adenylyltransferase)